MIDPMSREIGVSKSAFERLLKGRFKGVKAWLYERIRLSMIHALEAEMGRLENVLAVARLSSMAPDDDAILAAQAALKATRSLIEKVK